MKQILTFIFICLISTINSQNTIGIEVTYLKGLKMIKDKSNTPPTILKGLSYTLKCSKTESIFKLDKKMLSDIDRENRRFIGQGGGGGVFYKNLINKEKINQIEFQNNLYLKEDIKYDWKLTNERKQIGKYLCYKAFCIYKKYDEARGINIVQNYTVWYTLDIPFQFGPAGIDGLPGLVIIAQRDGYYFIADNIKYINTPEKVLINKPKVGLEVSDKKFDSIIIKDFLKKYGKKTLEKIRGNSKKRQK
ncbi:GLPGLI family protein [Polaribacter tangerinus]|uniref:GLPGLI family protein n=1 Tax=Polaribacter tangerinus TaxID=1920034 RepID=UPI000B4C11A2|nr:GLPGLI family protein [Polaribacter tangerinus]